MRRLHFDPVEGESKTFDKKNGMGHPQVSFYSVYKLFNQGIFSVFIFFHLILYCDRADVYCYALLWPPFPTHDIRFGLCSFQIFVGLISCPTRTGYLLSFGNYIIENFLAGSPSLEALLNCSFLLCYEWF